MLDSCKTFRFWVALAIPFSLYVCRSALSLVFGPSFHSISPSILRHVKPPVSRPDHELLKVALHISSPTSEKVLDNANEVARAVLDFSDSRRMEMDLVVAPGSNEMSGNKKLILKRAGI